MPGELDELERVPWHVLEILYVDPLVRSVHLHHTVG